MQHAERDLSEALTSRLDILTIPRNWSKFVDKILTNDLLFDMIFDGCSPKTLVNISLTCRIGYGAVKSYYVRACDVNVLFKRYFPNPLEFRALQRRTGAVVSGSTALQFFLRERYPNSDLDVYVRKDVREEVARWVIAQGYTFKPSRYQNANFDIAIAKRGRDVLEENRLYPFHGISFVFTFVKPSERNPNQELKVQIIVASFAPLDVILAFHTTAVLNIIAWDYAYCLYPLPTLERYEVALLRHYDPRTDEIIDKYTDRGFDISDDISDPATLAGFGGLQRRWIGDSSTWAFRLPTDGVPAPDHWLSLTRDPCVCAIWKLASPHKPEIRTSVFRDERTGLFLNYMDCDGILKAVMQEVKARFGWNSHDEDGRRRYFDDEFVQCYVRILIKRERG